jgi:hypothetical protein
LESEGKQLKILVDARLASAFKSACKESGTSMACELTGYMAGRIEQIPNIPQGRMLRLTTRGGRRNALLRIISMLVAIRDAEEAYQENIPENLQGGAAYESAENAIDMMDEAIALLEEAFG